MCLVKLNLKFGCYFVVVSFWQALNPVWKWTKSSWHKQKVLLTDTLFKWRKMMTKKKIETTTKPNSIHCTHEITNGKDDEQWLWTMSRFDKLSGFQTQIPFHFQVSFIKVSRHNRYYKERNITSDISNRPIFVRKLGTFIVKTARTS